MDLRKVKKLIELVEESGIAELEVTSGDESVRIAMSPMGSPQVQAAPVQRAPVANDGTAKEKTKRIIAPMSGTFYRAPSPDAQPYIEPGQVVTAGMVICIIESMKMMHEIKAEVDGTVQAITVENGTPVTTGDELVVLS